MADLDLVKLSFRERDDFTWTDDEIQSLLDTGMGVIGAIVFICDSYLTKYATESDTIKVGPITIDSSEAYKAWDTLKRDMILRWQTGIGVPGVSPGSTLTAVAGASTGPVVADQFFVGQFDNPPTVWPE